MLYQYAEVCTGTSNTYFLVTLCTLVNFAQDQLVSYKQQGSEAGSDGRPEQRRGTQTCAVSLVSTDRPAELLQNDENARRKPQASNPAQYAGCCAGVVDRHGLVHKQSTKSAKAHTALSPPAPLSG